MAFVRPTGLKKRANKPNPGIGGTAVAGEKVWEKRSPACPPKASKCRGIATNKANSTGGSTVPGTNQANGGVLIVCKEGVSAGGESE